MLAYFSIVEKSIAGCHRHCGQNEIAVTSHPKPCVGVMGVASLVPSRNPRYSLHRVHWVCFRCSSSNCITSSQISVASIVPKRGLENKIFPFVSISVGILEIPELIALGDSCCPMGMLGQNKGVFCLLFNVIYKILVKYLF